MCLLHAQVTAVATTVVQPAESRLIPPYARPQALVLKRCADANKETVLDPGIRIVHISVVEVDINWIQTITRLLSRS
jgi:hypothetical protein